MAQIIHGGTAMFDAMLYGAPKQSTIDFLNRQFENASQHLSEATRQFYQGAYDAFQQIQNNDYASRMLRAAGRAINNMWMTEEVQPLLDIGRLQHAPVTMQRWVMAEPGLRKLYHQQRVEGYSDSYVDMDPGQVGRDHYDYRQATSGMIFLDNNYNEDGECGWYATTFAGGLREGDEGLSFADQVDIQDTWKAIRKLREANSEDDPTSRFNARIG